MSIAFLFSQFGWLPNYYAHIYIYNVLEMFMVTLIFISEMPKRKYFWLRLLVVVAICFGAAYLFAFLRSLNGWNIPVVKMIFTGLIYFGSFGMIHFLCSPRWSDKLVCYLIVVTVRELVDCLYIHFTRLCGVYPDSILQPFENNILNGLVCDFIHLIAQTIFYLTLRKFIKESHDLSLTKNIFIATAILLGTTVFAKSIITYSNSIMMAEDNTMTEDQVYNGVYYTSIFVIEVVCFSAINMVTNILTENQHRQEKAIMMQVIDSEEKQYESIKTNMEIINQKAHDIRHQLANLQNQLAEDDVNRLKNAIKVYDNAWNTGNQVVDTVLYDRTLRCNELGIRITCLCDSSVLSQMDQSHLYYLLSNILDNAIEATREVKDEDKVISLNIKKKGEKIFLEETNYFAGNRDLKNDVIETSKKDKKNHGYGIKSIKFIASLYGGEANISIHEDMFLMEVTMDQKQVENPKVPLLNLKKAK